MTPVQIRAELWTRKISMAAIGRSLNPPVTGTAVQRVINRTLVTERVMRGVAEAIELPPEIVFPEREFNNKA